MAEKLSGINADYHQLSQKYQTSPDVWYSAEIANSRHRAHGKAIKSRLSVRVGGLLDFSVAKFIYNRRKNGRIVFRAIHQAITANFRDDFPA